MPKWLIWFVLLIGVSYWFYVVADINRWQEFLLGWLLIAVASRTAVALDRQD